MIPRNEQLMTGLPMGQRTGGNNHEPARWRVQNRDTEHRSHRLGEELKHSAGRAAPDDTQEGQVEVSDPPRRSCSGRSQRAQRSQKRCRESRRWQAVRTIRQTDSEDDTGTRMADAEIERAAVRAIGRPRAGGPDRYDDSGVRGEAARQPRAQEPSVDQGLEKCRRRSGHRKGAGPHKARRAGRKEDRRAESW